MAQQLVRWCSYTESALHPFPALIFLCLWLPRYWHASICTIIGSWGQVSLWSRYRKQRGLSKSWQSKGREWWRLRWASQPFAVSAAAALFLTDFYLQPLSVCSWSCQFCWYELKATWQVVFSSCCNYQLRRKQAAAFGTALDELSQGGQLQSSSSPFADVPQ